jgi:hypothetical protein
MLCSFVKQKKTNHKSRINFRGLTWVRRGFDNHTIMHPHNTVGMVLGQFDIMRGQ